MDTRAADSLNPESVVQRQLDAYNARDLEGFLASFGEEVRVYRPPATDFALVGTAAIGSFYAMPRFNRAGLHADVLNRVVLGNKVIDHERISGVGERPFEVVIVYEVIDERIRRVWTFSAE